MKIVTEIDIDTFHKLIWMYKALYERNWDTHPQVYFAKGEIIDVKTDELSGTRSYAIVLDIPENEYKEYCGKADELRSGGTESIYDYIKAGLVIDRR